MLTKNFEPKELLPFGQLRSLNQKDLIQSLQENEKIGIVIKDHLEVAMISMENYSKLIDVIREFQRLLELQEEKILYNSISERIENSKWEEIPDGISLIDWIRTS